MRFLHFDLGQQPADNVIVVELSAAANVRLMDPTNFTAYQQGRRHRYYGGHATDSPYHISIPSSGSWHLVVDTGGAPGRVSASVRVEKSLFAQSGG